MAEQPSQYDLPTVDLDESAAHAFSPWRFGFLACTFLALVWAAQFYTMYNYWEKTAVTWLHSILWGMFCWYLWGAMSLLVIRLTRRFPFARTRWLQTLAVHGLSATLLSAAYLSVTATTWWIFRPQSQQDYTWVQALCAEVLFLLPWNLITYSAVVGMTYAFEYQRAYRERTIKAKELEAQLARAQLDALKMQLHPHFLFNTLHAISTLTHEDPSAADRMVARLSDLLRHILDSGELQEVPLQQELDFLGKYLDIERVRFGDRLDVRFRVEPETLGAAVPDLILQPLVENSIRHGLAPNPTPCTIEITARRDGDMLGLAVSEFGVPVVDTSNLHEGVGLTNTRARLRRLYGDQHSFELRGGTDGGLTAHIRIPYAEASNGKDGDA